jgi:plasmid stabilization system protein ParE
MKLKYHPEASKEIDEAYNWYEAQQADLGLNFINEAEASVLRLLSFPNLNPEISKGIRRAIMPIFPYGIIYSINGDLIEIYAVAHLHRKPFYWKRRTK